MKVTATIDVDGGDGLQVAELTITNWDEQVKIVTSVRFEGPIYADRGDLMKILAALEVASD